MQTINVPPAHASSFSSDVALLFLRVKKPLILRSVSVYRYKAAAPRQFTLSYRQGRSESLESPEWTSVVEKPNQKKNATQDSQTLCCLEIDGLQMVLQGGEHQLKFHASQSEDPQGYGIVSLQDSEILENKWHNLDLDIQVYRSMIFSLDGSQVHRSRALVFPGSFQFSVDPFPSLSSYMLDLLKDHHSADVIFQVESRCIPAHRLLLARIPYFSTLLGGSFSEGNTTKNVDGKLYIALHDVSYATFLRIMTFIYTDNSDSALEQLDLLDAMALARAADLYGLPRVQCAAVVALERLVSVALQASSVDSIDIIEILQFANQYDCADVKRISLDYIVHNFAAVALTQRFRELVETDVNTYKLVVETVGASAVAGWPAHKRRKVKS